MTQLKNNLVDVADLEHFFRFDTSKLPTESGEAFKTYGDHQLEHLSTQYSSGDKDRDKSLFGFGTRSRASSCL